MKSKRELGVLLLLSYGCLVTVNDMWLFLTVSWAGLQCVIMLFPDHTHFFMDAHTVHAENQADFRAGYSTLDHIFVLHALTEIAKPQKSNCSVQ